MNNIGELFKHLNSDFCKKFYENVTEYNKNEIIDTMINNIEFINLLNNCVTDLEIVKNKINILLTQIIKKKISNYKNNSIYVSGKYNLNDTINNTINDTVNDTINDTVNDTVNDNINDTVNNTVNNTVNDTVNDNINDTVNNTVNNTINDTINDTIVYINNNIYMERIDHRIKITTPDFSYYY